MIVITKTISKVLSGEVVMQPEITIDFQKKIVTVGARFEGGNYSGKASFSEILAIYNVTQKEMIKSFFDRVIQIALNNGIQPDTEILDSDIESPFES